MNRPLIAAVLLAGSVLLPSVALADDPRLVERVYDPDKVVRIEGKPNVQAAIRFGEDEHIENVAIGDSNAWQVTPNKRANLLFVKPLSDRAVTNMTVITDRHTYLFDLVASPASRNPIYVLAFKYPEDEQAVQQADAAAVVPEAPNAVEVAAVSDPYAVVDPAELNFAWQSSGDATLLPAQIYDDGEATFLTWAPGSTLPAILVKDYEGTEGPVNFAVRGDVIVVDGVPREIVLRSGDDMAKLANRGPARAPKQAQPGIARANGQPATEVK
ncbi:MAG: TrbG/VirB9 family P-type conjugative transfer protein [Porphyrobacter sp.]|nr:TrbG/VirB9 family P-type conjugative transfer protein [Porphyrobacter sp.]